MLSWISSSNKKNEAQQTTYIKAASCWNGYERESAVTALSQFKTLASLQAIINRLSDYVLQVRLAATNSFCTFLNEEYALLVKACIPQLIALQHRKRTDYTGLLTLLSDFFTHQSLCSLTIEGCQDPNPVTARFFFDLCARKQLASTEQLFAIGMLNPDFIIRCHAVALVTRTPVANKLLLQAINDKHMRVRLMALRAIDWQEIKANFWQTLLFDKHPNIREIAVKQAQQKGVDVSQHYIDALITHHSLLELCCAIWAVGHLRLAQLTTYIETIMLSHPATKARKQAMQSLNMLAPETLRQHVEILLSDKSVGLSKSAANLCIKENMRFTADFLWRLYLNSQNERRLQVAQRLALHANKWERLIWGLTLLKQSEVDSTLEKYNIEEFFNHWVKQANQSGIAPTEQQESALQTCIHTIGSNTFNTLHPEIGAILLAMGLSLP